MTYAPDPEAVRSSEPVAIAYDRQLMEWSKDGPAASLSLAYGTDRGQQIEIYRPGSDAPAPVLIFLHGGAWIDGHLGWLRFMARAVTSRGFVFAATTYRLAPRCKWPAQLDDVRAALALIERRCPEFGGDPSCIIIGGHSAGGHLAAMVAVTGTTTPIAACMPVSSSFDLRYGDVPLDSAAGRVYRYLFADRAQDEEASPLAFVRPGLPPFHITWGEHDFERVAGSSERMVAALRKAGCPVGSAIEQGADHFDTHLTLRDPNHRWFDRLAELSAEPIRPILASNTR